MSTKRYKKNNVYEAAKKRIEYIFYEFDNIYVSFSGGKDSGIVVNLVLDYVKKHKPKNKVSVYILDYEGHYRYTSDYIKRTMTTNIPGVDYYWCCMPISLNCAVSSYQTYWTPWNPDEKDIWVRKMPKEAININNHNFVFFSKNMKSVDFHDKFHVWLHKRNKAKKTIGLLGIRADESFNRFRAIKKDSNKYDENHKWIRGVENNVWRGYPIYDWSVKDVWIASGINGWDYNKLYDLYYKAGLSLHQMRVASPFIDEGIDSLKLHRAIEPDIWGRLVGRVKGANFAAIYGGTKAVAYRNITLPKGHTWKSFAQFLLGTLPKETRDIYERKFQNSFKVWLKSGGVRTPEIAHKLIDAGYDIELLGESQKNIKYKKETQVIRFKDYPDNITLNKEFSILPSWKRMCITILKNDYSCKYMGYAPTKHEADLRKQAIEKYQNIL